MHAATHQQRRVGAPIRPLRAPARHLCGRSEEPHMARPTGCCAVTGGGGFIGRHIVEACLSEFDAVRSVDLVASMQSAAELHIADINEPDQLSAALRGCTAVIHCAGIVDTRSGRLHEQRIHRGNVAGTAAVIEACRREAIEVLVFVSSHSAVSDGVWGDDGGALRGEGNASAYGRSKLAAERAVVAAQPVAIVRIDVLPDIVEPGEALRAVRHRQERREVRRVPSREGRREVSAGGRRGHADLEG